ncbi:hypothetical protein COV16_07435 [Candidatus Woesearchaeota archaeon CG10_big_fil_rev_8_21_14_0_10_34_8]|nr:MAG: hypothetical protein COV16_07435 [Candidatus Woesearchaeota archaeon CG10_big_fil_rev_8_21_14_0_10_34_8]
MNEIILSEKAEEVYQSLKKQVHISKTKKTIFNAIQNKEQILKYNRHYGDPIAKRLFPKEYKLKYNITNLFRVELPLFWRLIYTITNKDDKIIIFVLDIIDHKDYNNKFGYRKN